MWGPSSRSWQQVAAEHYEPGQLLSGGHRSGLRTFDDGGLRSYYYHLPAHVGADSPIMVTVHGISRNAAEHMALMRGQADRLGAVLIAPLFDRQNFRGYQRLLCRDGHTRADLALIAMLGDLSGRAGLTGGKIHLAGFSGGAQFAHRFALFHSDLVASCVCCAAGWYTHPDPSRAYPLGTAPGSGPAGLEPHPRANEVPIHVIVDRRDERVQPNLNMSAPVIAQQGIGRATRARHFVKALRRARRGPGCAPVTLTLLEGFGHNFGKGVRRKGLDGLIAERFGLAASGEMRDA